jgi:putative DNA primase/helicase
MNELIEGARLWYDAGYVCIPTNADGSKRPYGFWKNYQDANNRPDFDDLARLIEQNNTGAIGVITGKASGNVEMIELEGRAFDLLPELDAFADSIGIGSVWKRLREGCVERSPSGGIHFFCRVSDGDISGNTPLAERPDSTNPALVQRLAETRGEGGFVVVTPSKNRKNQEGKDYRFVKTKDGQLLTPDKTPTFTQAVLTEIHRLVQCR